MDKRIFLGLVLFFSVTAWLYVSLGNIGVALFWSSMAVLAIFGICLFIRGFRRLKDEEETGEKKVIPYGEEYEEEGVYE